ncbi:MAG TPA: uroporphyrinogen decarboxylase family protein [bacterium]|nr:uroporphyrinogen decarboxylase family protein [bacterium]HNS49197.1 uroporphyrinogen decarboxylase family protein [bacterium]
MKQSRDPNTANFLKAVSFERPDWVPAVIDIKLSAWLRHGAALEEIVLAHPVMFSNYRPGDFRRAVSRPRFAPGTRRDGWGIVWDNIEAGLGSIPREAEAPLRDWKDLADYRPPSPDLDSSGGRRDWKALAGSLAARTGRGGLACTTVPHGFIYMWLYYLRGFTNLMLDLGSEEPRLEKLLELVVAHNLELVEKMVGVGTEMIYFGDDLGQQKSLAISPAAWRRWLKPAYRRVLRPCRAAGVLVYFHSDGRIVDIIGDLVETGVDILNPQFRANTLEGLRPFRGRVCLSLDLDRQLFPFAEPARLESHVREAVRVLNRPEGGLLLHAEIAHDVPLANIEALCRALENYAGPWHS